MKAGKPLGLSIVGGIDHASHPFGNSEPGVFISKVPCVIVTNNVSTHVNLAVTELTSELN